MEQCTLDKPDLGQCKGDRSDQILENVQKRDLTRIMYIRQA